MKKIAIACSSGGYKTVFIQGVLASFETKGFFADAYAGCSSSAIVSSYAAIERINNLGLSLWTDGLKISNIEGNSQSNAILHSLDLLFPEIEKLLWQPTSHRLLIATSFVKTAEAAAITQSDNAKRFGQKLLIEALRNNSTWRDENLELHIYDTSANINAKRLTTDNYKEVAYASTRMLHAWHIPAYINKKPYIDGSYTSLCPVAALLELGYEKVICILTENNKQLDMFSNKEFENLKVDFIQPQINLKDIGVDFYSATEESINNVFSLGFNTGIEYLNK
ncbi:hypothetical protein FACS189429_8060 [Bacteroidia bacterium]|nr:hypothetical protein FACS189429_8060 [Bacteroidia bacterium]